MAQITNLEDMDRYTIEYVDGEGKAATTECLAENMKIVEGAVIFIANGEIFMMPLSRVVTVFSVKD